MTPGFNPLHCGAVVASQIESLARNQASEVSIPFIAGQWSLPPRRKPAPDATPKFQSPSLRGSGRFWMSSKRSASKEGGWFQSPSLRGSGRFVTALGR